MKSVEYDLSGTSDQARVFASGLLYEVLQFFSRYDVSLSLDPSSGATKLPNDIQEVRKVLDRRIKARRSRLRHRFTQSAPLDFANIDDRRLFALYAPWSISAEAFLPGMPGELVDAADSGQHLSVCVQLDFAEELEGLAKGLRALRSWPDA